MALRLRDTGALHQAALLVGSVAILLSFTGPASGQSIGLLFDPTAQTCSRSQEPLTPGTLYVLALLGGEVADGITAAQFRIEGFPSTWVVAAAEVNPAATATLGDPFGDFFAIGFPCQIDASRIVPLLTIPYFAVTPVSDLHMRIRSRIPPRPNFPCPFVNKCDPNMLIACVAGGEAIINPVGSPCAVQVSEATWSKVKQLYH